MPFTPRAFGKLEEMEQAYQIRMLNSPAGLRMMYAAAVLFLFSGCVADQRNAKSGAKQENNLTGIAWERPGEDPRPAPIKPADVTASNNDNQQSQSGAVNLALGKFAEVLKTELTGVKAEIKTQIQNEFQNTVDVNLQAQNKVIAKAFSDFEIKVTNAVNLKLEAKARAELDNQQAWNQQISKLTQEMTAGRDVNNKTIQFTAGMQSILEKSYESQIDTVKEFCWMFVALISAGLAYLKLRENNDTKREMKRDELDSQEDLALIELQRKKTAVMQRGKHGE